MRAPLAPLFAALLLACSTPPADPPPEKDAAPDGPVDYFGRCTCVPPSPGFEFGCVALCDSAAGQHTVTCNQRASTCFSQRGGVRGGTATPDTAASGCDICRIAVNQGGLGAAIYAPVDAGVPDAPPPPDGPVTPFDNYRCTCRPSGTPPTYSGCEVECTTRSNDRLALSCRDDNPRFEECGWRVAGSAIAFCSPLRSGPDPCDRCRAVINEGCAAARLAQ